MRVVTAVVLLLLFGGAMMAEAQEDLLVLSRWMQWSDAPNMLYHHLTGQAVRQLEARASMVAGLKTEGQWLRRQAEVRQALMKIVGPFPEKTPLNPRMVGVLEGDGYRVEKLIYESMPNFYVTACLFIPDGLAGKALGV